MPFEFTRLDIPEVILIEPRTFPDPRGYFMETYKASAFAANGIAAVFVQDNFSYSTQGVLRGMHYQTEPHGQGKLLRVTEGVIFDVAVDMRQGSPTFGRWVGATLSAENQRMLWVPPGFGHGFCVLSEAAGLAYKVTTEYVREAEQGFRWDDPAVGIEWPVSDPLVSERDAGLPLLADAANNFRYGA